MIQKIVLVGYMGSGKSTTGKLLAVKLQLPFVDLDDYIEKKENLTVAQIFSQKSEIYFRKIEGQYFSELMHSQESFVLSLGGGTPCYSNNHLLLQNKQCQSFYLQASLDTLVTRLQANRSKRPLLADLSHAELKDFVAKQLFERSYFYMFCKHIVKTDNFTLNKIVTEIELQVL